MKIKLPVVDLSYLLSDDELEDLGMTPPNDDEIDYDSLPVTDNIFYMVHSIRPINSHYSALCVAGYEWTIKLPLRALESKIDKARFNINDN